MYIILSLYVCVSVLVCVGVFLCVIIYQTASKNIFSFTYYCLRLTFTMHSLLSIFLFLTHTHWWQKLNKHWFSFFLLFTLIEFIYTLFAAHSAALNYPHIKWITRAAPSTSLLLLLVLLLTELSAQTIFNNKLQGTPVRRSTRHNQTSQTWKMNWLCQCDRSWDRLQMSNAVRLTSRCKYQKVSLQRHKPNLYSQ